VWNSCCGGHVVYCAVWL